MKRKLTVPKNIHWNKGREAVYFILFAFLFLYLVTLLMTDDLHRRYKALISERWSDRNGALLRAKPNEKGYTLIPHSGPLPVFERALLAKEDRFFYYHFGVNPISILRDLFATLTRRPQSGSSTITQQVAKNLLGNESDRTLRNKLIELLYTLALEIHNSKRIILSMYLDTAYFGKQVEGVSAASEFYFGKKPEELSETEVLKLVSTLGSPSERYPGTAENTRLSEQFASSLHLDFASTTGTGDSSGNLLLRRQRDFFELEGFAKTCGDTCSFAIDADITRSVREILARYLDRTLATAQNGAVVVLKLPENQILAIIGSPHPNSILTGNQLNMAIAPRPIGSTAKPFIYLSAFERGARPYTLVTDEEYAYSIGTGFAFYPKNFDGKFRGVVTLHQALSNSLNVPAVKVLEFGGLPRFYELMRKRLGFVPYQPLDRYELGIALGALEMDLLTLSHYFTIFPNDGIFRPLTLFTNQPGKLQTPMGTVMQEQRVADSSLIRLVNSILADREAGVEQFGVRSSLSLPTKNYALKTGTSRDYHDSWTVGYTPDFLVGVWVGNSDNTPMKELSGQSGAGSIWHDVMTLLLASPYNRKTSFNFDGLEEFSSGGTLEYGLPGDDYAVARNLMKNLSLILSPHDGDTILLTKDAVIPLSAREAVDWFIDGKFLIHAKEASFSPATIGKIKIETKGSAKKESVFITVTKGQ